MFKADRVSYRLVSFDYLKARAINLASLDLDNFYRQIFVVKNSATGEEIPFTGLAYTSPNGKIIDSYAFYVQGRRQGQFARFYPSGMLHKFGNQQGNCADGVWYEFYESGALQKIAVFAMGTCLASHEYDESGVMTAEQVEDDLGRLLRSLVI